MIQNDVNRAGFDERNQRREKLGTDMDLNMPSVSGRCPRGAFEHRAQIGFAVAAQNGDIASQAAHTGPIELVEKTRFHKGLHNCNAPCSTFHRLQGVDQ